MYINTAISSLEELSLEQNIRMRLKNVCNEKRKIVSVLEGHRGTDFRPCSSDITDMLLNCSSAVSVVFSQKRNSSSFNCGSEEGDGNCEMQFFKGMLTCSVSQAVPSQSGWEFSSFPSL